MAIDREELEKQIADFIKTQSGDYDEFWESSADRAESVLTKFILWLFNDDIEKAKRKALYDELKKEFGDD